MTKRTEITIESKVKANVEKVWEIWTSPDHITKWNAASSDWHTTKAENDLTEGSRFLYRMEAKDGSMGFDFSGTYEKIRDNSFIEFKLDDDRRVSVQFIQLEGATHIIETFEAEESNPIEMQKNGWQAILDNFKRHTESLVD